MWSTHHKENTGNKHKWSGESGRGILPISAGQIDFRCPITDNMQPPLTTRFHRQLRSEDWDGGKLIPGLCLKLPQWALITALCENETQLVGPSGSNPSLSLPLPSTLYLHFSQKESRAGLLSEAITGCTVQVQKKAKALWKCRRNQFI